MTGARDDVDAGITTVGVYGSTADDFLAALADRGVGLLLDLRQRRGVRGAAYSWANAVRLQQLLAGAGVGYRHVPGLAPTTELRRLQYREDDRQGVGKRSRVALAPAYVEGYRAEILAPFDLDALAAELPDGTVVALLCVERDPEACHRSLVVGPLRAARRRSAPCARPCGP